MQVRIIQASLSERQVKALRACAYCRVSTGSAEQVLSLENQAATYERLIRSNHQYEFAGIYHDKAVTGSKENRPGFQKMLADARAGKIDLIITKSISRFARNTVTVLKYSRELKEIGVGIFFEEENINTLSKDGELMLAVLSSFAQEELRSMSNNQKWSVHKKYERGISEIKYQGMMGYYKNANNQLEINEEQAKVVRRIYSLYIDGMGMEAIAKLLNSEGISSYKNRKWTSTSIRDILKNEKYKGDFKLQKFYCIEPNKKVRNKGEVTSYYIEDDHQPIVSRNDWDKVQQIMADKRAARNIESGDTGKYQNRYPLSGLLICPYCGSSLKRKQVHNKRIEWWCSKSIKEGVKACRGIHVRDEDAMRHNITEPTVVKELIVNGEKHYSYTSKSHYDSKVEPGIKETEKGQNGCILQSVHRQRRAIIKL